MKRKIEFGCLLILTIGWLLLLSVLLRAQGILNIPCADNDTVDTLVSDSYFVVYSPYLRVPISADWVCAAQYLGGTKREPSWRFSEDTRCPLPRATHNDYTRSGYDRGHLVPAADRSASISSMKSTFIMTNVCPQVPSLNRGEWKRLEDGCRSYARNGHPLRVHVDAVWWPADTQRIGKNGVAVPHGFVKTIRDYLTDTICYSKYFQNW